MATSAAITALLRSRLGANSLDEVVAVVMRQIDHLRMLILAIESTMPEVNKARDLLYREIEKKLTAKNTNSWAKLEGFVCTVVDSACSPVSGLFPRDTRRAVREYYEGSFLATLSLLFDIIQGNAPDVSWKALSLQQELTSVAQRTGFFGVSTGTKPSATTSFRITSVSPSPRKPVTPTRIASSPLSSRTTISSPRTPSGLSWFIPADSDDDDEQSSRRCSHDSDRDEEEALRRPTLNQSSSILPSVSAKQRRSISQLTADSESLPPWPQPRQSGGARKSAERAESLRDEFATAEEPNSSPKLKPTSPSQKNPQRERSRSPSIGTPAVKARTSMIQSEFRTPSSGRSFVVCEKPVPLARRTLNFDDDEMPDQSQQITGVVEPRLSPESTLALRTSSQIAETSPKATSTEGFSESDQVEQQEPREEPSSQEDSGSDVFVDQQDSESILESKEAQAQVERPAERSSLSGAGAEHKLPDHESLSSRLALLEEELLNAKGRGAEFSSKLREAQDTISTLLENGTKNQNLLCKVEQESNNLMIEMEQFQDQGDVFFQNFESIRQDIRKLQQSTDQISTLKGVLAHTQSELASEKEKNVRAERELAELREQIQINELTSQFNYMESSARQLESQANIMQMLLQQTRRQLDAVRTTAAESNRIESEIQDALREHDEAASSYQKTYQDICRLQARLVNTTATMVDSATQYELDGEIDC